MADFFGVQISNSRKNLSHDLSSLGLSEMLCFGDVVEKFSSVAHPGNGSN